MLKAILDVNFLLKEDERPQNKRSKRIPKNQEKGKLTSRCITVPFKHIKGKVLKYYRKRKGEHV